MRLFQNIYVYPAYLRRWNAMPNSSATYSGRIGELVEDRYCGIHLLAPILTGSADAMLSSHSDRLCLDLWRAEQGIRDEMSPQDIICAQIEAHRADVFYTQDPAQFGPEFLKRLPGCVKRRVCWQSPPAEPGDLTGYDLVMNNFPTSLQQYGAQGVRTAYFTPALDDRLLAIGARQERTVDVFFAGGYTRHHRQRAAILESVAAMHREFRIAFALDPSRLTRASESWLGHVLPIRRYRRPAEIQSVSRGPVFGMSMLETLASAKIVLNAAVDSAGDDRGNMRCFEAMGMGALMLSDRGNYPEGMCSGQTMVAYESPADAGRLVRELLGDDARRQALASAGHELMRERYNKAVQWERFVELCS